jgi:glutamate---cysteine ligase / carboxylate-amine ligase
MAGVRTVGVEEELLLLDPGTREVVARAPAVLKGHAERGDDHRPSVGGADHLDHELFRHQLETRTDPEERLDAVHTELVSARRTAGEAAAGAGLRIGACGLAPLGGDGSVVTPDDRYRDMVDTYGEIARTAGTCAMHVHTEIASEEEGVDVLDRIAPWLPVLLAMSANSPYVDGRDSGYASWRAQVWSRWPTAGPTEQFGSVAGYREVRQMLLDSGAARDDGMLYFDARLSASQPTVEVRVSDVCTDLTTALGIVGLVRALVETAARDARAQAPVPRWRAEALRAAHWRASRDGTAGELVHPEVRELADARAVVGALADHVRPALADAGDLEVVDEAVERSVHDSGAVRQRAAFERSGDVAGVVDDLIARTEASWQSPEQH